MDYDMIIKEAEFTKSRLLMEVAGLEDIIRGAKKLKGLSGRSAQSLPTKRKPRKGRVNPTRAAASEILEAHGGPMETRDMLPLIIARGIDVGGKDPVATLSARLSNSDDFQNKRGVGWWFANRPMPGEIQNSNEAEDQSLEVQPSASELDQEGGDTHASLI